MKAYTRTGRALLLMLGATAGSWLPLQAATDYFAVTQKSGDKIHIFSYDTDATQVTYRTTIIAPSYSSYNMSISALPNHGFIIGRSGPNTGTQTAMRYTTTDKNTWTLGLTIDLTKTTTGAFGDSGIRSGFVTPPNGCGVAMLRDGKVFLTSDRDQGSGKRYYGLGDVTGLSGTVSQIFPSDSAHLETLYDSAGSSTGYRRTVTSTIEGSANRFVTCYVGGGASSTVMVYRADGTYKGNITPAGTGVRGLGVFKTPSKGDIILQVNHTAATAANVAINVKGIRVSDDDFDSSALSFTHQGNESITNSFMCRSTVPAIDGLESGRIIVLGLVRKTGDQEAMGFMIFKSTDGGTTWVNDLPSPMYLNRVSGASGVTGESICGLYTREAPEIASVVATNVTSSAAGLVGALSYRDATEVRCYWGTNDGGTTASAWMTNDVLGAQTAPVTLTNNVSGLTGGTPYFFRYWASNSADAVWAAESGLFTTEGGDTAVSVENHTGPDSVTATGARLWGKVTGGIPSPNAWIYWGTTDGEETKANWNGSSSPLAKGVPTLLIPFSETLSGLLANQTYYYRCYVSNSAPDAAWASTSANFTTAKASLSVNSVGVLEGALGTTNTAIFTVTLSAASGPEVTVDFATSDGTATVADNDYVATNGTLTFASGEVTKTISVSVVGNDLYESNESFTVTLSEESGAILEASQGTCTITNDDFSIYVRHGGAGAVNGADWANAYDTLQKALDAVSYNVPIIINAQASTGDQAYAVCARAAALIFTLEGGWTDVDGTPSQAGMSVIRSATTNQPGIYLTGGDGQWKNVLIRRFAFSDVSRGIDIQASGGDALYVLLTLSNTTIRAQTDGVFVDYNKGNVGGDDTIYRTKVTAVDVDIAAGLGGAGHGIYIAGRWGGSSVSATGTNVSTITSANGCGVYWTAPDYVAQTTPALFSNVVVYGCSSNGIYLDAAKPFLPWRVGAYSNIVRATLVNCTVADNGGDGLHMLSASAGSWDFATNCIFANNGGQGINLVSPNGAFTCAEGYNVFFQDGISTNGAPKTLDATDLEGDPLFYGKKSKPAPWYMLGSKSSPAWHSGSDNRNRGAYQTEIASQGTLLMLF